MNTVPSPHHLSALLKKLPAPTEILQGSLSLYYTTCYRPTGCHCHTGRKHGPYWYLSIQRGGKTKKRLIPKKKLSLVRQYLRNWKRYNRLIHQIMDTNLQIIKHKED
jgi:hypothetical protein